MLLRIILSCWKSISATIYELFVHCFFPTVTQSYSTSATSTIFTRYATTTTNIANKSLHYLLHFMYVSCFASPPLLLVSLLPLLPAPLLLAIAPTRANHLILKTSECSYLWTKQRRSKKRKTSTEIRFYEKKEVVAPNKRAKSRRMKQGSILKEDSSLLKFCSACKH